MKREKRFLAILLLLVMIVAQGVPVQASAPQLPSGIQYDELGTRIEEFVSEHGDTTAGMAISVFGEDAVIYTDYFGYADREAQIAVDQNTVMEWGSATKLLVWVSVMQLWEQERIALDADIREYLPEGFLTNLKYDTPITMLNLMNHNAGFQEVYADLFVKEQDAIRTLEDSLLAHEPAQIYKPGTVTAYSNWGVALAAYIVERVSGESFDDYVHRHIFAPLSMEHSALSADLSDNVWVQEKRKELQCYMADGTLIPDCFYYITLYPAGMCTSTLEDFETFGMALLNKDSPLFQKKETWNTFFTPTAYLGDSDVPSNYHGLWMLPYGVETVGHGGNTAGCSSYLLLDPQNKIGVVVMTNQSNETVYNEEMMELIFGAFSEDRYFDVERSQPEGIYRSARTVRTGPFKIMSLSFLFGEVEPDEFWMTGISSGTEKICFSYGDYVRVPVWQFVLEMGLFLLEIAALLFSVISLVVKLIRRIVCVCRKKQITIPLGRWSILAAFLQIAAIAVLAAMAVQVMSYALAGTYAWLTVVFAVLAVLMTGFIVYAIARIPKIKATKKRKAYNWSTAILLVVTVANILYWNLFMWWRL